MGSVAAQVAKRQRRASHRHRRRAGQVCVPRRRSGPRRGSRLQVDRAVDRRQLAAATPNGIDVYFDNVGGEILEAVLQHINEHARIVLCGGISGYDDMASAAGPAGYMKLVTTSSSMQGFTMKDYFHRIPEAFADLSAWVADGSLRIASTSSMASNDSPRRSACCSAGRTTASCYLRP